MVKRLGSKIKLFVFTIIILILTIEILSLIATKLNLLIVNEEPSYLYPSGDKWRTETNSELFDLADHLKKERLEQNGAHM